MRLLGLTSFSSLALPLARLYSYPLQFRLKGTYKSPADLFKGLKQNVDASQALHWWCTFKLQPKSICRALLEEVVITDASKEDYGGHMNNLFF